MTMQQNAATMGLVLGLLFGLFTVLFGFGVAFFILFCGGLGALFGWLIYGLASDRLNLGAAWRALQGQSRQRGPTGGSR